MSQGVLKRFYNSRDWKEVRDAYYYSAGGLCELCGKPGAEVHHIKALTPANYTDPAYAYDFNNLQLLCKACHNSIHEKHYADYRSRHIGGAVLPGMAFNEQGDIVQADNVHIVWGAPASGKSRYVMEHAGTFDTVIDLDLIINAIGLGDAKNVRSPYLSLALSIRNDIYSMIEHRSFRFDAVWVVVCMPIKREREELARRLRGDLIHIDADEPTCLKHARLDDARRNKEYQYKIIRDYFNKLQV